MSKIHYIKRRANLANNVLVATTPPTPVTAVGLSFQLSDMPGSSEFVNLFDSYRIAAVKLTFQWSHNVADPGAQALTNFAIPQMCYAIDRNDSAAPTTQAEIFQYEGAKQRTLAKPFSVYIRRPAIVVDAQTLLGGSFSVERKSPWISTLATNVLHFGFKYLIESFGATAANNLGTLRVYATYYLMFKAVK